MKKRDLKEQKSAISIEEVAELYRMNALQAKEFDGRASEYKEQLLRYAEEHPDAFRDTTLTFECGVRVEMRATEKATHEEPDMEWLDEAIEEGLGAAISVKIDHKKLPKTLSAVQRRLLNEVDFMRETKVTMAVYADKKS